MDLHGLGVRSFRVFNRNAFQNASNQATAKTQHLSVRIFFLWFKARLQMQPYAMLRAQGWTHCSASMPIPPIFWLLFTVDGDGWGLLLKFL